uniref:Uncharacterized protein n=1 Tax=Chromera velia CCMP2878 TaxID=1169474 RepID=A0A0G4GKE6_9ALVE|eukprot:Cvel_4829.t1-p1 / transcript=Cvel_4829.t1 / gene=Cvel_4829 / organism=Chromera_velia_CCMP2878 / gene_product=hypothetical protein / transcript_product=hypothetical protein / location=Cvel_scaffold217:93882-98122(+) / protein_length=984 / sequence_SO=supercontig / SO=protein_coding / is_pseudo=false
MVAWHEQDLASEAVASLTHAILSGQRPFTLDLTNHYGEKFSDAHVLEVVEALRQGGSQAVRRLTGVHLYGLKKVTAPVVCSLFRLISELLEEVNNLKEVELQSNGFPLTSELVHLLETLLWKTAQNTHLGKDRVPVPLNIFDMGAGTKEEPEAREAIGRWPAVRDIAPIGARLAQKRWPPVLRLDAATDVHVELLRDLYGSAETPADAACALQSVSLGGYVRDELMASFLHTLERRIGEGGEGACALEKLELKNCVHVARETAKAACSLMETVSVCRGDGNGEFEIDLSGCPQLPLEDLNEVQTKALHLFNRLPIAEAAKTGRLPSRVTLKFGQWETPEMRVKEAREIANALAAVDFDSANRDLPLQRAIAPAEDVRELRLIGFCDETSALILPAFALCMGERPLLASVVFERSPQVSGASVEAVRSLISAKAVGADSAYRQGGVETSSDGEDRRMLTLGLDGTRMGAEKRKFLHEQCCESLHIDPLVGVLSEGLFPPSIVIKGPVQPDSFRKVLQRIQKLSHSNSLDTVSPAPTPMIAEDRERESVSPCGDVSCLREIVIERVDLGDAECSSFFGSLSALMALSDAGPLLSRLTLSGLSRVSETSLASLLDVVREATKRGCAMGRRQGGVQMNLESRALETAGEAFVHFYRAVRAMNADAQLRIAALSLQTVGLPGAPPLEVLSLPPSASESAGKTVAALMRDAPDDSLKGLKTIRIVEDTAVRPLPPANALLHVTAGFEEMETDIDPVAIAEELGEDPGTLLGLHGTLQHPNVSAVSLASVIGEVRMSRSGTISASTVAELLDAYLLKERQRGATRLSLERFEVSAEVVSRWKEDERTRERERQRGFLLSSTTDDSDAEAEEGGTLAPSPALSVGSTVASPSQSPAASPAPSPPSPPCPIRQLSTASRSIYNEKVRLENGWARLAIVSAVCETNASAVPCDGPTGMSLTSRQRGHAFLRIAAALQSLTRPEFVFPNVKCGCS